MKRQAVLVPLLAMLGLQVLVENSHADDCQVDCTNPDASVSGNAGGFRTEIVYRSNGEAVSIRPGDGAAGATFEYQIAPACSGNSTPGEPGTSTCEAAYSCPDGEDIRFFVFYREVSPDQGSWQRGTEQCLSPHPFVNDAAIRRYVSTYVNNLDPPASQIDFEPPTGGVANVPVIFHTTGEPIVGSSQAFGLTVTITATPHWHWDFDDSATLDTDDPGRGYDGTDPRKDPTHYLTHTYGRSGSRTVRLTTTWTATYERSDQQGTFAVAETVTRESARVLPVEEYEGRLTDAG